MIQSLSQKVKSLPHVTGVYILKDAKGNTLYVGKASRLRDRVRTYFVPSKHLDPLHRRMQKEIADIEILKTQSEIEALVLESKLIKSLKPRYNIVMRDDKQYFYVAFSKVPFSKIFLTHQKKPGADFIGPFVNGRSLKVALRLLRKVFPYCSCKRTHANKKACLNYAIGIDPGWCCSKESPSPEEIAAYKKTITHIKHILKGQKKRVLQSLKNEMGQLAKQKQFEKAAIMRDQLRGIEYVLAHKGIIKTQGILLGGTAKSLLPKNILRIEGYDISNVQGQFAVGSMVVFERDGKGIFAPKKNDYRRFKIKTVRGSNDPAMMREVISRRLMRHEWPFPQLILVDGGKGQRNAALKALSAAFKSKSLPFLWGLAKREEELYTEKTLIPLVNLDRDEARLLKFIRDEAHRFAISYYRNVHKNALLT